MITKQELGRKLEGECFCHLAPPCAWCESLSEDEVEASWSGGRDAVIALIESKIEAMEEKEAMTP